MPSLLDDLREPPRPQKTPATGGFAGRSLPAPGAFRPLPAASRPLQPPALGQWQQCYPLACVACLTAGRGGPEEQHLRFCDPYTARTLTREMSAAACGSHRRLYVLQVRPELRQQDLPHKARATTHRTAAARVRSLRCRIVRRACSLWLLRLGFVGKGAFCSASRWRFIPSLRSQRRQEHPHHTPSETHGGEAV